MQIMYIICSSHLSARKPPYRSAASVERPLESLESPLPCLLPFHLYQFNLVEHQVSPLIGGGASLYALRSLCTAPTLHTNRATNQPQHNLRSRVHPGTSTHNTQVGRMLFTIHHAGTNRLRSRDIACSTDPNATKEQPERSEARDEAGSATEQCCIAQENPRMLASGHLRLKMVSTRPLINHHVSSLALFHTSYD